MLNRRSLRLRVTVAFALFGGLLSLMQATWLYFGSSDLGERLIDETLNAELDDYIGRRTRNPHSVPENTATIRGYVIPDPDAAAPPPVAVATLQPGQHALLLDGSPYRAAVRDQAGQRFVVLYNEQKFLRREQGFVWILAAGAVAMTLLAAILGYWLAGRVIAPVTDLARRVATRCPTDSPPPLAHEFPWDEVHELAQAVDGYESRLQAFIERERLFTGDVSHELRTPLAVINGALELLRDNLPEDSPEQQRVLRVARAANEMAEITDALLVLAREKHDEIPAVACDAETVVREVVAKLGELHRNKPIEVQVEVTGTPRLRVERAVLVMAFGNLIRNAFGYTDRGRIRVELDEAGLSVTDTGRGIASEALPYVVQRHYRSDGGGEGIGLSLVQRICERYGWSMKIDSEFGQGTRVRLNFTARTMV